MDPQATLALIFDAIAADDSEALDEHTSNLLIWLRKGGAAPIVNRPILNRLIKRNTR